MPIYGGASMESQIRSLKRGVDVVIATPGRALDHLTFDVPPGIVFGFRDTARRVTSTRYCRPIGVLGGPRTRVCSSVRGMVR